MNRIKTARQKKKLTQAQLAEALNVGRTTVTMWETSSQSPDKDTLIRLSQILNVSVDYLLGNDDNPSAPAIRIPVLGSVPAGIPLEAIEDIVDWEELPTEMASGGREYFGLEVKGDSMWPDYLPGDVVIVRKQPTCHSGDDCVVYVNGYDATLKQVRINDIEQSLTLVPRNQSYPPRTFNKAEIETLPVSIAGVVVELRRKIKK